MFDAVHIKLSNKITKHIHKSAVVNKKIATALFLFSPQADLFGMENSEDYSNHSTDRNIKHFA